MTTATQYTAEHRANTAFHRVMETAPMGLLVSAALGLAIVGVFQYIFYLGVLPSGWSPLLRAIISGSLAAFFEALGFYFLVATVRDFSAGHQREGYIGLTATFLLWAYALWESHHISAAFDAGGKYWAIMGIIGTIVCVVRVVELRITLTVTSAFRRRDALAEAETTIADYRKQLESTAGKLAAYEAEKAAIEHRNQEAEKAAKLLEQQQHEAEVSAAFAELDTLRRRIAAQERRAGGQPVAANKRADIERRAREFYRKNNVPPTQEQAAKLAGLGDARALRHHFPNGTWDAFVTSLTQENQQEILAAN